MNWAALTPFKLGAVFCIVLIPLFIALSSAYFLLRPSSDTSDSSVTAANNASIIERPSVADIKLQHANQSVDNSYYSNTVSNEKSVERSLVEFLLPDKCRQKILFITARVDSLKQAESFRTRFKQDKRLASLPICIHKLTWLDPVNLECQENVLQNGRLGCNLALFARQIKSIDFTHIVVFAEQGKANVHNGIMFLDAKDSYDVFVHELAHFAGFIDEYPVSKMLVERICAGVDAPNIVFKQPEESEVNRLSWDALGLHGDVDISVARTCDNHPAQAFKASNRLTFMEYHDVTYIPKVYLAVWQKQLLAVPRLPSAHLNFAQAYEEAKNRVEGQFWRSKYQQYLNTKPAHLRQ